jgi:hypothetical protein
MSCIKGREMSLNEHIPHAAACGGKLHSPSSLDLAISATISLAPLPSFSEQATQTLNEHVSKDTYPGISHTHSFISNYTGYGSIFPS